MTSISGSPSSQRSRGCSWPAAADAKQSPARPPTAIYRLPLTDNPVTLDPALFTDVNSEGVARRIFNKLVKLDAKLQPVPDLAESWKVSEDGLTYTFALRKGVRFHNGREMVADDVRFSFERLLRAETASQRAWVVEPIAGARELRDGKAQSLAGLETPDACTVVLRLKEAFSPALMLQLLAMGNAAIVPREEVQPRGGVKFGRRPVGTGPFRFVSWRDHDAVVLARNDQYFGGPAKLAGLRFRVIKESLVAWQEYFAGGLEHCAVPEGFLKEAQAGAAEGRVALDGHAQHAVPGHRDVAPAVGLERPPAPRAELRRGPEIPLRENSRRRERAREGRAAAGDAGLRSGAAGIFLRPRAREERTARSGLRAGAGANRPVAGDDAVFQFASARRAGGAGGAGGLPADRHPRPVARAGPRRAARSDGPAASRTSSA